MTERLCAAKGQAPEALAQARKDAAKEAAAVLGFSSAVAAYGAFFIPKSYGTAISINRQTGCGVILLYHFLYYLHSDYLVELRA